MKDKNNIYLALSICIALPIIIYFNSLKAPFVFDDLSNIVLNEDIKQLSHLKTRLIFKEKYGMKKNDPARPVTFLTLTLNYHFGKLNPLGYHLFNLAIHVLNVILIFFLTIKIIPAGFDIPYFPLFVALLFASHPINTEAVTYISHRSDSLATLFYLLSIFFFTKTIEREPQSGGPINNRMSIRQYGMWLASLLCFVLSLLSKQIAASLPVMLLIFDFLFVSDSRIKNVFQRRNLHLPYWLALFIYTAFRYFYIGHIGDPGRQTYERWTTYSYLLTQISVVLDYLKLLSIPTGQSIDHFVQPIHSFFNAKTLRSAFLSICIFASAIFLARKNFHFFKIISFSVLWFFVTLIPTSSIFPINDAMAERRLYLPTWGFFIFSAVLCELAFGALKIAAHGKIGFLTAIILLYSVCTIKRNQLYGDPIFLWKEAILAYPGNPRAHYNLGYLYQERKEYGNAKQSYIRAIQADPRYTMAYNNLASLCFQDNEYERAEALYLKTIELDPGHINALINLANVYYMRREFLKAENFYKKAIDLNPNDAEPLNNLGNILYLRKDYDNAETLYAKAIALNTNNASAKHNLAMIRLRRKQ